MIAGLGGALHCLQARGCHDANTAVLAYSEGKAAMDHHLPQEKANGIAELKAARGQDSAGLDLELVVNAGPDYLLFHSYNVATFMREIK
jgi:hypothetical protein